MKVKATFSGNKFGFYGGRRIYDGQEFTLADPKSFSEKWMVKLEERQKPGPKPKPKDETGAE